MSRKAGFLHGKFVWSSWDVDEFRAGRLRRILKMNRRLFRVLIVGADNGV